jgi:hypothetical protein
MNQLRNVYAEKAISQIPRILSLQDRNPFSPTYGCMHRDYWLYKTSDFADAVRQFGVHALALVYARDFPNNPYRNHPKIRDWAFAFGFLFNTKMDRLMNFIRSSVAGLDLLRLPRLQWLNHSIC